VAAVGARSLARPVQRPAGRDRSVPHQVEALRAVPARLRAAGGSVARRPVQWARRADLVRQAHPVRQDHPVAAGNCSVAARQILPPVAAAETVGLVVEAVVVPAVPRGAMAQHCSAPSLPVAEEVEVAAEATRAAAAAVPQQGAAEAQVDAQPAEEVVVAERADAPRAEAVGAQADALPEVEAAAVE